MPKEVFLINPPKKLPKSKKKHSKKHRILALERSGGLFTSKEAKIVRKGIKLNPFRQFRSNPLGEELMFVGLNPFPKKGGHSMAKRKRKYKRNPAKSHRRRYRRNPMSSTKSLVPMAISGGAGALVGRAVPQFIPVLKNLGTLGNVISKAGLAVLGAMAIDKFGLDKKLPILFSADGWVIGSAASAVADLSSLGIVKGMAGLGMIEDETLSPYNGGGVGELVNTTVDPYAGSGMGELVEPY